MSITKKVIKYIAIAFGIFLTINIIGGIIALIGMIFGISNMFNYTGTHEQIANSQETVITENIKDMDLEISLSQLNILEGKEFKIDTENKGKGFEVKTVNNKLIIKEKNNFNFFSSNKMKSVVNIYIPKNIEFENVNIKTDVSNSEIKDIKTKKLKLEIGAGKVYMKDIESKETQIKGGVGKTKIEDVLFENLDLESGVGKFELSGKIYGNSSIKCGVGSFNLNLVGNKEDYKIYVKDGIGRIKIKDFNENTRDNSYGNGNNIVRIENGIGSVDVDFI